MPELRQALPHTVYLVIEPIGRRIADVIAALVAPPDHPSVAIDQLDVFFRADLDTALVAFVLFDRDQAGPAVAGIHAFAASVGAPLLDPDQLDPSDNRRFRDEYLQTYECFRAKAESLEGALYALAKRRGVHISGGIEARGERAFVIKEPASPQAQRRHPRPSTRAAHLPLPRGGFDPARPDTRAEAPTARRRLGSDPESVVKQSPMLRAALASHAARAPSPDLGAVLGTNAEKAIDVRFLRGGQWASARLRALSNRGAYLVTSAPPRKGDSVHLALGFQDASALMVGVVYHVTPSENHAQYGSSGFSVRFEAADRASQARLTALIREAVEAGVKITAPPARTQARFPLRWPVRVGEVRAVLHAELTDCSNDGAFIATESTLSDRVTVRVPMDEGRGIISFRGEIVRHVDTPMANQRDLKAGYGVKIHEIDSQDVPRWQAFVTRVSQRTEKRVLVAASPSRSTELADAMTAAGYVVIAGTDPGLLMQIAAADPRPPDATIIDADLANAGGRRWLEALLANRDVPCITTRGESASRTRAVIDEVLDIRVD